MIPYPVRDTDDLSIKHNHKHANSRGRHDRRPVSRPPVVKQKPKNGSSVVGKRWSAWTFGRPKSNDSNISPEPNIRASTPAIPDDSTLIDAGDKIITRRTQVVESVGPSNAQPHMIPFVRAPAPVNASYHKTSTVSQQKYSPQMLEGLAPLKETADNNGKLVAIFVLLVVIALFNAMTGKLIESIKQKTGLN
ncbi:LANO_0A06854g1_1 [Lachancea nothofagi CBS 11611]|uniref:LANO_0A06854g1_1 n=1 Tax=Lachancea nothofagi CBS 11611 TaxID=1266666 RepID=A0A1G4IS22_9SACH|nr:LANO_0A06854g1_1 [Lachancea nothofagi CBS 11611]